MAGKGLSKRRVRLLVLAVLVAGIGYGVFRVVSFVNAEPTISVDYAGQYNELVRPANYDPNSDAAPDYEEAFARLPTMSGDPGIIRHLREYDPASVEYKILKSWLDSCEPVIDLLHRAAAQSCFWLRVSSSDPNCPLPLRSFAPIPFHRASLCLRCRAEHLATHGHTAEAFRCIVTDLRMAAQLNVAGRSSIGQSIEMGAYSMAFDLLADPNIDASLLGDAQRQLEDLLAVRTTPSFQSDGIVLRDLVQRSFTDGGDGHVLFQTIHDYLQLTQSAKSELGANFASLSHFWIAWHHPNRQETIQTVDRLTEAADRLIRQPPWERQDQGVDPFEQLRDICNLNAFLRIARADRTLFWAITNQNKNLASFEGLIATMSILRFHKDKGVWPAGLEELVTAGYIRTIPLDPYSGKPLVYARKGDSFILYSYGEDCRDHGGTPKDPQSTVIGGDLILWPREGSRQ